MYTYTVIWLVLKDLKFLLVQENKFTRLNLTEKHALTDTNYPYLKKYRSYPSKYLKISSQIPYVYN